MKSIKAEKFHKFRVKYIKQKSWIFESWIEHKEKYIGVEYHLTIPALEMKDKIIINGEIYEKRSTT